jgi:putative redox protein
MYITAMKITMERANDAVHIVGKNNDGNQVLFDGSPAIGGEGKGARPMEVVLMALGGCSSMDVLSILKKMRQELQSYRLEINGQRDEEAVPSIFKNIHVDYFLHGSATKDKVLKATAMSMDTYCSVTKILEKTATITYSVFLNDEQIL